MVVMVILNVPTNCIMIEVDADIIKRTPARLQILHVTRHRDSPVPPPQLKKKLQFLYTAVISVYHKVAWSLRANFDTKCVQTKFLTKMNNRQQYLQNQQYNNRNGSLNEKPPVSNTIYQESLPNFEGGGFRRQTQDQYGRHINGARYNSANKRQLS